MSSGTVAPGSVVGKRPGRRLTALREGGLQALPFLAPALVLVFFFLIIPVIWTVLLSVNKTRGLNFGTEWIGLDNYERLLTRDSRFLDRDEWPWTGALVNNIRWLIVYPILCLFLGLLTAVLATRVRYEAAFKAIIFVPMAISATAVGVIWLLVYSPDPDIGVLNATITGLGGDPVSWLGRGDTANYAIILAYVWASTGFVMVVLSAALKGISQEVIEAARTDGATEWDIFRRIQFPLLSLPIAVVSVGARADWFPRSSRVKRIASSSA